MQPVFPGPSAGFDDPLEILAGCHERILRNCDLVERIAQHVSAHGPDEQARTAATNVIRYFDTAGAHHHEDEELDLFPALRQHAPSAELNATLALLMRLRSEHERLDALWTATRARLAGLVQGRDTAPGPILAREFKSAYASHIELEDAQLLPLARRALPPEVIRDLGGRMARRRGVKFGTG